MIRILTAHTYEIDDADQAIAEVMAQLSLEENLQAHSVGILACHYEFVYSGTVRALCAALPFPVVGAITSAQAVPGQHGGLLLTLMVLTSQDVTFQTALTESLLGAPSAALEQAYREAVGTGPRPALMLSYAAFLLQNSGDEYVAALSAVSGGVPCFGTLAVDDTSTFDNAYMIYNGEHYRDRMGLILLYGPLSPQFYIATISDDKIITKPARITASQGHVLKEVDGVPLVRFFESYNLTKAIETRYAMSSVPIMLDYGDGTPLVSKVFIRLNDENHGICAGAMPEGATLYLGVFDKRDVVLTSRGTLEEALAALPDASGALIYSCVSRYMTLGADSDAELKIARELLGDKLPMMMAYSGGEICPTPGAAGLVNRFHNNAFVLCVF
jgi:hypothetical protein